MRPIIQNWQDKTCLPHIGCRQYKHISISREPLENHTIYGMLSLLATYRWISPKDWFKSEATLQAIFERRESSTKRWLFRIFNCGMPSPVCRHKELQLCFPLWLASHFELETIFWKPWHQSAKVECLLGQENKGEEHRSFPSVWITGYCIRLRFHSMVLRNST